MEYIFKKTTYIRDTVLHRRIHYKPYRKRRWMNICKTETRANNPDGYICRCNNYKARAEGIKTATRKITKHKNLTEKQIVFSIDTEVVIQALKDQNLYSSGERDRRGYK